MNGNAQPLHHDPLALAEELPFSDELPGSRPDAEQPARALRPVESMESAWRRMLSFLAENDQDQGVAYERARRRLVEFFIAKGELNAEELADATFDRLLLKLNDQLVAEVRSPMGFVLRFAHFIYLERVKSETARRQRLESMTPEPRDSAELAYEERSDAARMALIDRCLAEMPASERRILLTYYQHDGRSRIASRQEMSRDLGINAALLRTRISRLRAAFNRRVRALAAVASLA